MSNSLYDRDFYAWANEQAALLRAGRLTEADIENIAEEIDSMGRSEKRELINRLAVLLVASAEVAIPAGTTRQQLAADHRGTTLSPGGSPERQPQPEVPALAGDARMPTSSLSCRRSAKVASPRSTFPAPCPFTYEKR